MAKLGAKSPPNQDTSSNSATPFIPDYPGAS